MSISSAAASIGAAGSSAAASSPARLARCCGLPLLAFGALASHRAATHSAIACVAVAGGVALALAPLGLAIAPIVAGAMGLGYAAHVLADACTPAGVRLWWPLSRRRVWLLPAGRRIATGSVRELLLAVCVLALVVLLVVA